MATKSDFSEQEWEELHRGVTGAGLLVSVSDRSFFDGFKEAGAMARHLAEARSHGDNLLVRDLASERGTGFGLADRPDKVEQETLAALRTAVTTLQEKAPSDLPAYRTFVLDVARSVAASASGGDEAERETVAKLEAALSTEPSAT
jgi:hypothetical protein